MGEEGKRNSSGAWTALAVVAVILGLYVGSYFVVMDRNIFAMRQRGRGLDFKIITFRSSCRWIPVEPQYFGGLYFRDISWVNYLYWPLNCVFVGDWWRGAFWR